MTELENRHARPLGRLTLADARHAESLAPADASRLRVVVDDADGTIVAFAFADDGLGQIGIPGVLRAFVRVDHTRTGRGIGQVLADRVEAYAAAERATRIVALLREDEPRGVSFARRRGYTEFHRRFRAFLDLEACDTARFPDPDDLATRAGVRLLDHGARMRERGTDAALREAHAAHRRYVQDIPRPRLRPTETFDQWLADGPGSPTFAASASFYALREGRLVGLTLSEITRTGVAHTIMTGVDRDQRGKGLALALKLKAITALRVAGVRFTGTSNDKDNLPMLAVNRRLGYVPEPAIIHMERQRR
ncbi:MAG TPA: GNAT family N-acetyltransferase [Candidatus Limnocylindria bacterium]|nr:GNAT family N-acetyltransferase [Candidatus Limnocylindria bacterium]